MKEARVLRVWGTRGLQMLLQRWERGFTRSNPGVRLEARLTGSQVAMAALYADLADVALLGRESTPIEDKAFEWIHGYPPTRVEILTGSLDRPGQSAAPVVFVYRDNPLSRLTLVQLDGILGCQRLPGAGQNIRTWDALGLTADWAGRGINLYTHSAESGTAHFLRHVVLRDSRRMNREALQEFNGADASRRILKALAADRFGLAVAAGSAAGSAHVRPLPLARTPGEPFFHATRDNLIGRRYALTRAVYAYFNRYPGGPVAAPVGAFLRHVLSAQAQRQVAAGPDYLPLDPELARHQSCELERTALSCGSVTPAHPDPCGLR